MIKNLMIFFVVILFSSFSSDVFPSFWSASKYTQPTKSGFLKSILVLSKDNHKLEYNPVYSPLGMIETHRFLLNSKLYFVTVWPDSSKFLVHRVFSPQNHTNERLYVICEIKTSSEDRPGLKVGKNGSVIIRTQIFDEKKAKLVTVWQECEKKSPRRVRK